MRTLGELNTTVLMYPIIYCHGDKLHLLKLSVVMLYILFNSFVSVIVSLYAFLV